MKKLNNKAAYRGIALCMLASLVLGGCEKFETREFIVDKPQSIIDQEKLDSLNELKTYVNYSNQPDFKLGAELSLSDLQNNSLLYRLVQKQFNEISLTRGLNHLDYITADGSINSTNLGIFQQAMDADSVGMPIYAGSLVKHENQQASYLNGLIADIIIPGESGNFTVADFEGNAIGDSYPVMGSGTSAIANDPDGKSGKTLNVVGAQTFPQFQVTLPAGLTLGNCKSVTLDFKGTGSTGLYGQGMRMGITTALGAISWTTPNNYNSPSGFGCPDGSWGRGLIILPIAQLGLTDAQKQLTSFVLTVGSATGSANYLMDNVTIQWEKVGGLITKTPEEKAEIIQGELDKWIKAIGEAGKDKVKSWSVVYQPIDETDPSKLRTGVGMSLPANTFYWQDYLGKDYGAIAIQLLKQYANANDKIFFTETNLLNNPAKIQGLMDFIAYTESKGQNVDGIATELALNIDADKAKIESTLEDLAATGKLIKISALDVGTGNPLASTTAVQYQAQADFYKWFVKTYFEKIPSAQRAGITFRSPIDQASSSTWRANEPVGLWTGTTNYLRKLAYKGVVEALQEAGGN